MLGVGLWSVRFVIERRVGQHLVLYGFLCLAADAQELSDWLIVPGESVGPITAMTSEAILEELFGPGNVESIEVYMGEGFTEPGTAVYPEEPTKRIEVVWRSDSRTVPKEVRLTGTPLNGKPWKASPSARG